VLVGNLIGVLPGMGALQAISILLPLTYAMHPVPAILMLAGIFYGSQYGGAIGAILMNMPSHPPHAVTCLDGYPMTKQGKGGVALGVTMIASFFAASVGIIVMIFASPLLVQIAFKFGPTEIFSIMLLGLLAGSTMSRGSPLKGVAMTLFGLLCGVVGTDVNSGSFRFAFGLPELSDGLELVAISMGLFGVADFLLNVNRMKAIGDTGTLKLSDMRHIWYLSQHHLITDGWSVIRCICSVSWASVADRSGVGPVGPSIDMPRRPIRSRPGRAVPRPGRAARRPRASP